MTPEIDQTLTRLDQLTEEEKSALYKQLQEHINWLINNNFSQLVQMLYRLDVDEDKIRSFLQNQQNIDAATLIANFIIERQLKKAGIRKQTKNDNGMLGDERWE